MIDLTHQCRYRHKAFIDEFLIDEPLFEVGHIDGKDRLKEHHGRKQRNRTEHIDI